MDGQSIFNKTLNSIQLPDLISVNPQALLVEVLHELQKQKIGAVAVAEGSSILGIFSERDFLIRIVGKVQDWKEKKIADFMTKKPIVLNATSSLKEATIVMIRRDFRHIPVWYEEEKKWKIISAKDILRTLISSFPNALKKYGVKTEWNVMELDVFGETFSFSDDQSQQELSENSFLMPLRKAIFRKPLIVDINDSVYQVLNKMQNSKQAAAIVTKFHTEVEGIITERDFLFKIFDKVNESDTAKVSQFMTAKPHTLLSRHFICYAINNMFHFNYRNVIIVDEDQNPLATVTLMDILKVLTWHIIPKT